MLAVNGMAAVTNTFIYIHAIWCTANREPVLTPVIRKVFFPHIRQAGVSKGIQVLAVNGTADHVHCLFKLIPAQSPTGVVNQLKEDSETWLNSNQLLTAGFNWDPYYTAYSVSPSTADKSIEYILRQEEYHQTRSLEEELEAFSKMVVSLPGEK